MQSHFITSIHRKAESWAGDFVCQEAYRHAIMSMYSGEVTVFIKAYECLLSAATTCLLRIERENGWPVTRVDLDSMLESVFLAFVFNSDFYGGQQEHRFWVASIANHLHYEIAYELEASEEKTPVEIEREISKLTDAINNSALAIDKALVAAVEEYRCFKTGFHHKYSPLLFLSSYDYRHALRYFMCPVKESAAGLILESSPFQIQKYYHASFYWDNNKRWKPVPDDALSRQWQEKKSQSFESKEHFSAALALDFCGKAEKVEFIDWVNMSVDVSRRMTDSDIERITARFKLSLQNAQSVNIRSGIQCASSLDEVVELNKQLDNLGALGLDDIVTMFQSNNLKKPKRSQLKNYLSGMILYQSRELGHGKRSFTHIEQDLALELESQYGYGFSDESIGRGHKDFKSLVARFQSQYC